MVAPHGVSNVNPKRFIFLIPFPLLFSPEDINWKRRMFLIKFDILPLTMPRNPMQRDIYGIVHPKLPSTEIPIKNWIYPVSFSLRVKKQIFLTRKRFCLFAGRRSLPKAITCPIKRPSSNQVGALRNKSL